MNESRTRSTTHCRAGLVVFLAGNEGKVVEDFYGTCLAAQLIYRESGYEINPDRFFDDHEKAMSDMERLAEGES